MSFVYLGGDDTTKPTYFEVLAADKLVPSLKAAAVYTISVLSQRTPWLHRVLQYEDEVLACLMLLVDWHSLSTCDATFAEGLYGLKRSPAAAAAAAAATAVAKPQTQQQQQRISQKQRLLGLLLQVGLPYVESKLNRWYKLHADRGVLGLALRSSQEAASPGQQDQQGSQPALRARLQRACLRAFLASYPWVQAGCQGLQFTYHLSYLLGPSAVHRPVLQALGMRMARVSAQDMELMAKEKAASRQAQLVHIAAKAGSGLPARGAAAAAGGMLRAMHLLSDHYRNALILAVFGFKALEWWYTSAEERLAISKVLPPPPPPPPPLPSQNGVGLPADPSLCPVCRRSCTNPAQVATSGFVFCYPCIFNYIMDRGCCPVTNVPATLDHIRKLYEA